VLGLAALAAGGCGGAVATKTTTSVSLPNVGVVKKKGVAYVAVPYLPSNFNPSTPAGANRVTQMVMEQVWPQAFVVDPSFGVDLQPGFIDSTELVSLSPETVVYKIDPLARWSDGVPITWEDFYYDWREQLRYAAGLPFSGVAAGYRDITSISAAAGSPKTVTVVFGRHYVDWEGLFANLVPAHIAKRVGWVNGFARFNPRVVISGGPFRVARVVKGREIVLTMNTRYWGTPPHVAEIVFEVVPEAALWRLAAQRRIDVAETFPDPAEQAAMTSAGRADVATSLSPLLWQICFNLNDPIAGDTLVRQAIAAATDRAQMRADTVAAVDPLAPLATSRVFLAGEAGYLAGGNGVVPPTGNATTAPVDPFDLPLATSLLRELGYRRGADGYMRARGKTLSITLSEPAGGTAAALGEIFQAEMKQIGMRVVLRPLAADALYAALRAGRYQVALAEYQGAPFPSWVAPMYSGGAALAAAGGDAPPPLGFVASDVTRYRSGSTTSLWAQARTELNTNTDISLYHAIDAELWTDLPTIPLFQSPVSLVVASSLAGVTESPTWAGPMWDAQNWHFRRGASTSTTTTGP
jgi:peptide/nickel transport system substrate-binding protein